MRRIGSPPAARLPCRCPNASPGRYEAAATTSPSRFSSRVRAGTARLRDKNELAQPGRTVRSVLGRLVDAVFPAVCVGCGRRGAPLCDTCACPPAPPRGAAPPPAFVDDWFALYEYDGLARELVARIKYRNARAIVPHLARAIADTAARRVWTIDCVTFAPTTN